MTSKKDVTESAKDIRVILKAEWPKTKFSVRSERYAGGSSVDLTWTDGPTLTQVDQVVEHCAGYENGYYTDYIITQRYTSREVMETAAATVAAHYDLPIPELLGGDLPYCEDYTDAGGEPLRDRVHRLANTTDAYKRDIQAAFEEVYPAPSAPQKPSGLAPEQEAFVRARVAYEQASQARAADLPRLPEDPTDADFEYFVGLEIAADKRYRVSEKLDTMIAAEKAMLQWARAIIAQQMAGHPELDQALGVLDDCRRFPSIREKVIEATLRMRP